MWSTRYRSAGEDYVVGTTPNRFLAAQAALLASGADALSVADGEGRNAVWLAEQGLAVTATEISAVALEKARKLAAGRHVGVRVQIGVRREPGRRVAPFAPAHEIVVTRRVDLAIAKIGIDLAIEVAVHRNHQQAMDAVG